MGVANRAGPFGPTGFPKPIRPPGVSPWHRALHHSAGGGAQHSRRDGPRPPRWWRPGSLPPGDQRGAQPVGRRCGTTHGAVIGANGAAPAARRSLRRGRRRAGTSALGPRRRILVGSALDLRHAAGSATSGSQPPSGSDPSGTAPAGAPTSATSPAASSPAARHHRAGQPVFAGIDGESLRARCRCRRGPWTWPPSTARRPGIHDHRPRRSGQLLGRGRLLAGREADRRHPPRAR